MFSGYVEVWSHERRFSYQFWIPSIWLRESTLACGAASVAFQISAWKMTKIAFLRRGTERLNLWHGGGAESWEISLQRGRLSMFGADGEILGGRGDTSAKGKKSQKRFGERKLEWRSLRQWGERGVTEGAAETEIRSYFITVWTAESEAGCWKAIRKAKKERRWKAQKRLSTLGLWCRFARSQREDSSNKQMNFLIPVCNASLLWIPTDLGVCGCVWVCTVNVHLYTNQSSVVMIARTGTWDQICWLFWNLNARVSAGD